MKKEKVMIFITLTLIFMIAICLLTFVPLYIVEKSPNRQFLGFFYDTDKMRVVPPLWVIVLYAVFFVFFSSSYLYLWIRELKSGNYNFRYSLHDTLLFLGVLYFATIPLVRAAIEELCKKTSAEKKDGEALKYLSGIIVGVNKEGLKQGTIYCYENKRYYPFFFKDVLTNEKILIIEGLKVAFFEKTGGAETKNKKTVDIATNIILLRYKSIFWNLYIYLLKVHLTSWWFYVYPALVLASNPDKPLRATIGISLYLLLLPLLLTWLRYKNMKIRK